MQLQAILADPTGARRYLERYVNDGSPSGFTQRYTSSNETSPFGETPSFPLWYARLPDNRVHDIGVLPSWLPCDALVIHPDMRGEPLLEARSLRIGRSDVSVTPTASSRTVEVIEPIGGGYVKLHYDGLLGRVNRRLTASHARAALDVTAILKCAAPERRLPPNFCFLAESGARIGHLSAGDGTEVEWGTVFRELDPQPTCESTAFLIPSFSLFGRDRYRPHEPCLVEQLASARQMPIGEYIFRNIARPIVACYFEMLLRFGLQFECNAQNIVLGFDANCTMTSVIFRDFESVDKDISLVEELGLPVTFASYPFKCVHRGLYNYSIKHSFMYDFKLGEYVLTPLLALASVGEQQWLTAEIRELARKYIRELPPGFFPDDGLWYSYANVVVDKTTKRPYVGAPNPRYR